MKPPSGAPRRLIGLVDATALVVGSMIGSGIFIVSAESARLTGTPGRLLLVWALAGTLTLLAAAVVVLLAIASSRTTLPGFGLVLVGIPVFFARRRKQNAA